MIDESIPDKGDLVFINFSPQSGSEQAGHRPAIVLSPKLFNKGKFVALCPITKKQKGYPFEVPLPEGSPIEGVILADQIRTFDWRSRGLKIKGQAPEAISEKCVDLIHTFI
ncbi:type II toxin-antitoxin system PemK/MazF family toxin [Lentibacillus jeotgali]|uniref:type II toxin-antitoxin system PemK/MazF family toxin n=1 Tax=Lentibacillus jeotgali TaxID=558169 RepID=UPI0002626C69|nr:type II toxin-antitoxin system PemK/MazF family toxin [Lentibacillus jeotgali]